MSVKNKWLVLEATLPENFFLPFSIFVMLMKFTDVLNCKFS